MTQYITKLQYVATANESLPWSLHKTVAILKKRHRFRTCSQFCADLARRQEKMFSPS